MIMEETAREILNHQRSTGRVPGNLTRWAETMAKKSTVDWRRVLGALIRRGVQYRSGQDDYTLSRPRRGPMSRGIIQPGTRSPLPDVAVVLDTSGSMRDKELAVALGEVQGILRKLGLPYLWLIDVDTRVGSVRKVSTVGKIDIKGGGGTDMRVGIDAALKLRPTPSLIIVLTDGYTPWPSSKPRVPVIVGLLAGDQEVPGWAKKVVIEP